MEISIRWETRLDSSSHQVAAKVQVLLENTPPEETKSWVTSVGTLLSGYRAALVLW